MRALVTVTGQDRVGIIASVCNLLAERNINHGHAGRYLQLHLLL